jgi:tRNA-2-methylthio-N6-dimethylallyladenosine synthase
MSKRLYIHTVGCQMNVLDSELVAAALVEAGYELVDGPSRADTILFNTCSVRQHAEDKIYSALGRLKHVKEHRPQTIIGVLGCMAEKDRAAIFRRARHVDLVVGPGQLGRLPAILAEVAARREPRLEVGVEGVARVGGEDPPLPTRAPCATPLRVVPGSRSVPGEGRGDKDPPLPPGEGRGEEAVPQDLASTSESRRPGLRPSLGQALVRAMFGCNQGCAYCIVPRVRGPERSRPAAEITAEVRGLVEQGCLEVTLVGQTVNHYSDRSEGRRLRLADLLARLDAIDGLRRLRFVTNHPRFMTAELVAAVRDLPKVCPYLHVPAQSGSDQVLRRMRRGHTAEAYREMLERVRKEVPHAAVTSDFIVGFPGETEADFQQTVELVRWGRFKNSFIFKYSPRPLTPAVELYADDVPEAVKRRRNNDLLAIQNAISLEENRPFLGRRVEILVEGPSKTARRRGTDGGQVVQLAGRTVCDRIVVFDGPAELAGKLVQVEITEVDAFTLFGEPREVASGSIPNP